MMRVFWDEWRGGMAFSVGRAFPAVALVLVTSLVVLGFQPGAFFLVAVVALGAVGFVSGTQRWNQVAPEEWLSDGVSPWGYALGKVTGLLAVSALWLSFLAPVGLLLALAWGVPATLTAGCLGWALAGAAAVQVLGQLATWSTNALSRVAAGLVQFGWFGATTTWEPLQKVHPLWQVGRWQQNPDAPGDPWFVGLVGAIVVLWFLMALVLRWRARR